MQKVDAAPYRGKRVRFRAAVRTQIENEQGTAHLWLRVDLPQEKGRPGSAFFDNMFNRPIDNKNWDHYEIIGDVAENAEVINIGMFLRGHGRAWIDDVTLEVVGDDARPTGRDLAERGTSFDKIGPGLLEIVGGTELKYEPSLRTRVAAALLGAKTRKADQEAGKTVTVLLPLPLAYRQQVPVTYELTVDPPDAAKSVTVYQDTPHNHVAKVVVLLNDECSKVDIDFHSLVLVGPSSFDDVPDRAPIPERWPEECQPWLESTWCVESKHERIQEVSREIRSNADDLMTLISGVEGRAFEIFTNAQGQAHSLIAVDALDGRGSCTSCANLVAALLRASDVPARVIAGYPSWSGPLQTHYIVEAYIPEFGWYPIESTLCKSPWANEYQVNVAIVPPKYESKELADLRSCAAGGVPYLSLTEMPNCPSGIIARGTVDRERSCDHNCKMVRKFSTEDDGWAPALDSARSRWQQWLAAQSATAGGTSLVLAPKADRITATSPSELIEELSP
jgi:hypothetical protein